MAPTTSFAPLAGRLEILAVKIRADLEGRILIEQFYGIMFCMLLYGWIRVCHQMDARAATTVDEACGDVACGNVARGAGGPSAIRLAPRVRPRLVADEALATASPGIPGSRATSCPVPNIAKRPGHNHFHDRRDEWPGLGGCRKTRDFRIWRTHVLFVTISKRIGDAVAMSIARRWVSSIHQPGWLEAVEVNAPWCEATVRDRAAFSMGTA